MFLEEKLKLERIKQWVKEYRERLMMGGIVFLLVSILILSTRLFTNNEPQASDMSEMLSSMASSNDSGELPSLEDSIPEKAVESILYVDIKGAITQPGVYEMKEGDRVKDIVQEAGGFTAEADQMSINLALRLSDQMMLYIPKIGEEADGQELMLHNPGKEADTVNINTADISELTTLNGIGEKKAEKIIQYRKDNGSFENIEEIKNVSGIGEKTFESLKDFITVTEN